MKKTLIINGHPNANSYCNALATAYQEGAASVNAAVELVNLCELNFDPNLRFGYQKRTELEPDLLEVQTKIQEADHLVFVYPNWWGSMPALLKGFFDRVFLPGFAFKYRENSALWDKLLQGKTAQVIITMDTPVWYYKLVYRSAGLRLMRKNILEFCGIKVTGTKLFAPIKSASDNQRQKWINKVRQYGQSSAA